MREVIAVAFYVTVALFAVYYAAKVIAKGPQVMCGVAEISPDFNPADRARCRQLRRHKL